MPRALERALEIVPDGAYSLWSYGVVLCQLGRFDESIAIFEQLVAGSQRRLPLYLGLLGSTLATAGDGALAGPNGERVVHPLADVRLRPPVTRVPVLRDFAAVA